MPENVGTPKVGDTIRVAGKELAIRAVIVERDGFVLAEAEPGRVRPSVWVLSAPRLVRLSSGLWEATGYRSLERPEESAAE